MFSQAQRPRHEFVVGCAEHVSASGGAAERGVTLPG
jgi:hypothetical protein